MCVIFAACVQSNCMIVTAAFFPEFITFIVTYTDTMHGIRMKMYQQSNDHISMPIVVLVLHILSVRHLPYKSTALSRLSSKMQVSSTTLACDLALSRNPISRDG